MLAIKWGLRKRISCTEHCLKGNSSDSLYCCNVLLKWKYLVGSNTVPV